LLLLFDVCRIAQDRISSLVSNFVASTDSSGSLVAAYKFKKEWYPPEPRTRSITPRAYWAS
jgi:hypothetical protein